MQCHAGAECLNYDNKRLQFQYTAIQRTPQVGSFQRCDSAVLRLFEIVPDASLRFPDWYQAENFRIGLKGREACACPGPGLRYGLI